MKNQKQKIKRKREGEKGITGGKGAEPSGRGGVESEDAIWKKRILFELIGFKALGFS